MALISLERLQLAIQGIKIAMQDLQDKLKTKLDKSDYLQADLSQDDVTASDYVKNRTHYDNRVFENITVTFDGNIEGKEVVYPDESDTTSGLVKISENTPELQDFQVSFNNGGEILSGVITEDDFNEFNGAYSSKSFPLTIVYNNGIIGGITLTPGMWSYYITDENGNPMVYMMSVTYVAQTAGEIKLLDEKYIPDSVARTEDVMNVTNPAGTGSFSMNRLSDTDIGEYSSTEGCQNTASGVYSHAEGYCTIADSEAQHVQGKFNLPDGDGVYTHIVGNGTSDGARSNAHTLDTQGNAWFAGDVYVGSTSGTNIDEGSKKLATEEFIGAFYTGEAIILSDIKTAKKYMLQIEDGNLVTRLVAEYVLIDFDFTKNADGSCLLTGWKETFNGESSTELVIPDHPSIIL